MQVATICMGYTFTERTIDMQITTTDGTANVASTGVANTGLITGIIGTVLGLANGGNNLLGNSNSNVEYATKSDLEYAQTIAEKDSEISLLKSESNTESKIIDVYERVMTRVNADKAEQLAINTQQAVVNAQVGANIAVTQNDVADLKTLCGNLTQTVIPITNVSPEPMKLYNSWTAPTTTTTTT